ncbi:MAG: RAD55 family ATPase [Thermoplasmatota archaeon]
MSPKRGLGGTVSSGITALDGSLEKRGFKKGSIILYVGDPGSRKDLFGYSFILDGLEKGERVAFYDVEASSDEILEIIQENVSQELLQNLDFMDACPEYSKFFINAVPARIIEHMRMLPEDRVNRVLINPLTFFLEKFGIPDTDDLIIMVREIAMQKGIVVVFLMADILGEREMQSVIDKFDGILELRSTRIIDGIYHTLTVNKFSLEQKSIQLSYNIVGNKIQVTSTGKII